jgi:hypothetical protein
MSSGWADGASPLLCDESPKSVPGETLSGLATRGLRRQASSGERLKILMSAELVTLHLRYEFEMLGETRLRRFNASTRKPAQNSGSCCALGQLPVSALSPSAASFAAPIWASIRNHRAFSAKPARGCGGKLSSFAARW